MTRIVHYYPRALVGDGGPTVAMWAWASAMADYRIPVAIAYDPELQANSPLIDKRVELIPVRHVGSGRWRIPLGLGGRLRETDVLVLHSAFVPANQAAALSAWESGQPYLVQPHGGYQRASMRRHRLRKSVALLFERALIRRALAVHVHLSQEAHRIRELAPFVHVITAPMGFPVPQHRWTSGGGYLAWVGRYDIRHKGLDLLFESLSQLPSEDRPQLRLRGRDSVNGACDVVQLAAHFGVQDCVVVGGPVAGADRRNFLLASRGYVHPSAWESFGISLVEALAYGIPSLVTATCDIAPWLEQSQAALVAPSTPQGVASGLSKLWSQPVADTRGRDFVAQELSWDVVISRFGQQMAALHHHL